MLATNLLDKIVRVKSNLPTAGGKDTGIIVAVWVDRDQLVVAVAMEDGGSILTVPAQNLEILIPLRLYSVWLYRTDAEKIRAIKVVRSITGMGLKEAKDHVEKYASNKVLIKDNLTLPEAEQIQHQIMAEDHMEVEIRKNPG